MVVERRINVRQKNYRAKGWRITAIGFVLANFAGAVLAEDVDFSLVAFEPDGTAAVASDIQDASCIPYDAPCMTSCEVPTYKDWCDRFSLGGYGEMHANFTEGKDGDLFDLHRMVMFVGYEFTEWLTFTSELEVEHAFVAHGDGEISFEQAYVESAHAALCPGGQLLGVFYLDPYDEEHRPGEGPPHGVEEEELVEYFVGADRFTIEEIWRPKSAYPGREGLELMMRLRRVE